MGNNSIINYKRNPSKSKMKTEKEENKKPNQLEKLVLDITAPIKMNQEITLQAISVLLGANNTGKSFMLKIAYALGAIGTVPVAPPGPNSMAQFVFDNTFTDQKFDGLFKAVYTLGHVAVEIKEGKVISVEVLGKAMPTVFMSTDIRTFDQMTTYLRIRKDAGNTPLVFMQKMLEAYRLYDVTYMEGLLGRLPLMLSDNIRDHLKNFDFIEPIASVEANLGKCEFHAVLDDGSKKNLSTYGKGHQAILNMAIAI